MTNANAGTGTTPLSLQLYRQATRFGKPLIDHVLARRLARAKEDANRISERKGVPGRDRPPGPLVWCHAASVGEALALLSLIDKVLEANEAAHVLVTTGTVTSAALMAHRLPQRALHQFIPVDYPGYVEKFLNHWRPNLALWMESELWPNLLSQTRALNIPMALVNARMSDESFRRWQRASRTAQSLLRCFDTCLAQDEISAERLRKLGAARVVATGNLKFAAPPLAADPDDLATLNKAMTGRPSWLAASTHSGEEEIVARTHDELKSQLQGLLTTIVPRHPDRGASVADTLSKEQRVVALRSRGDPIVAATDIYVADTLGELGLFYRLNAVNFVGGSMVNHGGQNPLEAARLGSAILHGPHVQNFTQIYDEMNRQNAAHEVVTTDSLAGAVLMLLNDSKKRNAQVDSARQIVGDADSVLSRILSELSPYLTELDRVRSE